MRMPVLIMIFLMLINVGIDTYIYKHLRSITLTSKTLKRVYLYLSILLYLYFIAVISWPRRNCSNCEFLWIMWSLYIYFSIYIAKYIYFIFDIIRIAIRKLFKIKFKFKWITITGIFLPILIFGVMLWGAFVTRNQIEVSPVTIFDSHLPNRFNNYKIVQFSDFHLGSYGRDTMYVSKVVTKINSLNPDLIVFTGDIVNRDTKELYPFIHTLSRLKAKDGIYSILGNHDYGDYKDWSSKKDKQKNMLLMYKLQSKLNWNLLNNDNVIIHNNNDSIVLIGVENWGDPPFPKYGDLNKAYKNLNDSLFKILLTHNPVHWREEIIKKTNINLTLSGHTHAMQFLIGNYSPASMRYRDWGGLYEENNQKLYVNIGIGEVAIPARVGAIPEITLITLKNGSRQNNTNNK